jgi:hypothetical protein
MTFTYIPLSEEDAEKAKQGENVLLTPAIYDFQVIKTTFKMSNMGKSRDPSKPSNPTIELLLKIKDHEGKQNIVNDWLIGIPKMEWKTRAFCRATGTLDAYEEKTFNENMCLHLKGKASILIERGKENPNGGYFPDKNVIDHYVPREITTEDVNSLVIVNNFKQDGFDDNIPF